jgi:hypothetical protein
MLERYAERRPGLNAHSERVRKGTCNGIPSGRRITSRSAYIPPQLVPLFERVKLGGQCLRDVQ